MTDPGSLESKEGLKSHIAGQEFDPTELFERLEGVELTPDREAIMQGLLDRPWFQNTDTDLQVELITLPQEGKENHDGFLEDLAGRKDIVSDVEVLRLSELARAKFSLIPIFDVRKPDGREYTYEYPSWRYGPKSGVKGIIIGVNEKGEATSVVTLRAEKFATGYETDDCPGGFMDLGTEEEVHNIFDRFIVESGQEAGLDPEDLKVGQIVRLGPVNTDAGMTNNAPELVAALVSEDAIKRMFEVQPSADPLELKADRLLTMIDENFSEFLANNRDGVSSTALLRCIARGIIRLPLADT